MKTICLYFQVHQPFRFKRYRFFNIGNDHYYYDDYANESILRKVADHCYLPANRLLIDLIEKHKGKFKVALSISGMALDQFELYAPEVLDSFKDLVKTGSVELLAETNAHSLATFKSEKEFTRQVRLHEDKLSRHFDQKPEVFRNTELIYSDEMGQQVAKMGYRAVLTEGAKHILGWKSPNLLYCNAINPKLKVLLRNFKLSDDIAFRFSNKAWSEWPLTAEKYVGWLNALPKNEEIVNIFLDYETFGEHQWKETGIFDFLAALPGEVLRNPDLIFGTPGEIARKYQPVSAIHVPHPISWADEEKDLTAWLGNELQEEAYNKLYALEDMVSQVDDAEVQRDWMYLQASDHFYYMCTKFFSDGEVHAYFNPYESPYDAFINYMNILSDFTIRVESALPETAPDTHGLKELISEKEKEIEKLRKQVERLKKEPRPQHSKKITKTPVKTTAKKTTSRAGRKTQPKKPK